MLNAEMLEAPVLVMYSQLVFEMLAVIPPENGETPVEASVVLRAVRVPVTGL